MTKISVCLTAFLLVLFTVFGTVNSFARKDYQLPQATDGQVSEAIAKIVPLRFLPSSPLYFLITIKETFNRFFQSSSVKKTDFDLTLADKRIKEAYLLLAKEDTKSAGNALLGYSNRVDTMMTQLDRARSQNQDVVPLIGEIADDLRNHEIILSAIDKLRSKNNEKFNAEFDSDMDRAVGSFVKAILGLDSIKPGIRDRFKFSTGSAVINQFVPSPTPSPTPSPILNSSPNQTPRKIIY